ncbi:MAG: hypothetical protein QXL85_06815 [Candidatus Bathyarchaeia archaeon]
MVLAVMLLWLPDIKASPSPPVYNLNTGEGFYSIQEAINDPGTADGHIIAVNPGTYTENVIVRKSLIIRSVSGNPGGYYYSGKRSDQRLSLLHRSQNPWGIG